MVDGVPVALGVSAGGSGSGSQGCQCPNGWKPHVLTGLAGASRKSQGPPEPSSEQGGTPKGHGLQGEAIHSGLHATGCW